MQLRDALTDISEIRAAIDRNQTYRGFRSAAIGLSAVFVVLGGFAQLHFDLQGDPSKYLDVWLCVALVSMLVTAVEMIVRGRISNDMAVWKMHGKVAITLMPSFLVGALVTAAVALETQRPLALVKEYNLWLLPALWSLIYSLGLFAVCKRLHRMTSIAAMYYLAAGCVYLIFNWTSREVAAWHMVTIFGIGQLLLAVILYWKVERARG